MVIFYVPSTLWAMDSTKPKQIRVYLREAELQMLNELVEITGIKDTAVLTLLCTAALKAAKEADYRVPLALKFKLAEGLTETTKPPNKIRR
jgi:hypothetical protein